MRVPKNPHAAKTLDQMPPGVQSTLMQYSDFCRASRRSMPYRDAYGEPHWAHSWAGTSVDPPFSSTDEHWDLLEPTREQRQAAVDLSKTLTNVMVTGTTRRRVRSETGPGDVNAGVLVRGMAAMSRREVPDWRGLYRNRKMAESPRTPLRVGFLLDTSFSMDAMSVAGATTAWIVAEATRKVSGKIATAVFGYEAWPLAAPGEYMPLIPHLTMFGGEHHVTKAYEMVDAVLDLADGDGARLLVAFTDGEFSIHEPHFGEYLAEAERAGVAILVLSNTNATRADFALPGKATFVNLRKAIPGIEDTPHAPPEVWPQLSQILSDSIVNAIEEAKQAISH